MIESLIEKGAVLVESGENFDKYIWFGSYLYACKQCGSVQKEATPCPNCNFKEQCK